MNKEYGEILDITVVENAITSPIGVSNVSETNNLGITQMMNILMGHSSMDGYHVKTTNAEIFVLIDNGQSCCESWGYFSSDDDMSKYIGATLHSIDLTDVELNKEALEKSGYYQDDGGIQFVDFVTDKGKFQLAVYNAHNGYYGHGIIVAIDGITICNDVL